MRALAVGQRGPVGIGIQWLFVRFSASPSRPPNGGKLRDVCIAQSHCSTGRSSVGRKPCSLPCGSVEAEADLDVTSWWRSISLDNLLIGQLAIFRADANRSIGGGHIMRCLALADALVERGWRCVFAVSAETTATVPHLKRAQHDIHILSAVEEGDPAALLSTATEGCQLLVIDHYGLGAHYEAGCRSLTRQILVIDDLADRAHDCDLLLDQKSWSRSPRL